MIISKTPLRCSFFGGGTDFPEYYRVGKYGHGTALSTALDMYVYIMVSRRFDEYIRVCYTKNEFVKSVDVIEHNIIREALKLLNIEPGIDIVYSADLPFSTAGVGLASSSALAVGVLTALHAYKGEYVPKEQIAREACVIEIEKNGHPMGVQDQYACACGGLKRYRFYADDTVSVIDISCSEETKKQLHRNLMLFYTGITRQSGVILGEQELKIKNQVGLFDEMTAIAEEATEEILSDRIDSWGKKLDLVWQMKKRYASTVSNPEIDVMYKNAKKAGAMGGKILGAGGGGFMLLYVPEEKQASVDEALHGYKKVDFQFEHEGTRIIFAEKSR